MNTYRDSAFLKGYLRHYLVRMVVFQVILMFGGMAVLRCLGGPGVHAFAAALAYMSVVGLAMYLVEKRWPFRG